MNRIFLLLALLGITILKQLPAQQVQKATPYPDCIIAPTFSATGTAIVPQSQSPIACAVWVFAYTTNGVPSVVSIVVQTAPDNNGAPGSWSNATATTGSNPNTATTQAISIFGSTSAPVAFPWWRINLTTLTGGGKINAFLYGWKLSAALGGGGGGSCSGLAPLFTASGCTFSQIAEAANKVYAGPASGGNANPTMRYLVTNDLPNTAVTPGSYGDSTHVGQFTVDAKGRLTTAASVAILAGSAGGNYTQAFTSQTTVVLTHNFGTTSVIVQCADAGTPPDVLIPQNIALTDANDVTVTFSSSQSGSCTVNASANSGTPLAIGDLVGSSTPQSVLFIDASHDLAQDANMFVYRPLSEATATGQYGLQIGPTEPDLSCCDGPANALSIITNGSAPFNFSQNNLVVAYSGNAFAAEQSIYSSQGTVDAPTDLSAGGGALYEQDFFGFFTGAYRRYITNLYEYDASPGIGGTIQQTFEDDSGNETGGYAWGAFSGPNMELNFFSGVSAAVVGFAPIATGEMEANNGSPVANGGSLAQIDASAISTVLLEGRGSAPGISGCTAATISADSTNVQGEVTAGAVSCTFGLTFTASYPHGVYCNANDETTGAFFAQTAQTVSTSTLSGTSAPGDVISYHCEGR